MSCSSRLEHLQSTGASLIKLTAVAVGDMRRAVQRGAILLIRTAVIGVILQDTEGGTCVLSFLSTSTELRMVRGQIYRDLN